MYFFKIFIFRFLASQKLFFAKRCISKVLHSGMSYFQSFHFSIFSFPEALFSQNAAFPEFCTLECLISKVFIFRFLASQKLFFRKSLDFRRSALWNVLFPKFSFFDFYFPRTFFSANRCISGVLHSGMSYFQSFHFSIFSFPEAFFSQNAAFPEFCTLECLISKVFIFDFYLPRSYFFCKTLHFRSSALWNVLFPKFSFFDF